MPAEHDLLSFANAVRQAGEKLPGSATSTQLGRLSVYGGAAQYPGWEGETTDADVRLFSTIARQLHDHAERRAHEILEARGATTRPASQDRNG